MEPISTTAMISVIVGYLSKKIKDNKSIQDFFNDFTSATVDWIRPIFLTEDNKPKEVLEDLAADPTSELNTSAAENAIAKALKKDPNTIMLARSMFETIQSKEGGDASIFIRDAKNVVTGSISAGGNVHIGDQISSINHQTHSGSGDNVAGNKNINKS